MLLSVIEMILPLAVAFAIGIVLRRKKMMDDSGCQTLKTILAKFLLPVILLNAFMFANYTRESLAIIIVFFLAMVAEFSLGFVLRRFIPERAKYFPFVFATVEGGSIGYPLMAMLYATRGTSDMAIIDVAHTFFLFLIVIPIMQMTDGNEGDFKKTLGHAVLAPTFLAMVLGMILGLLGVDTWLVNSPINGLYQKTVGFLSDPAGLLILITLGYDISLRADLRKPVLFTICTRFAAMWAFCALSCLIIFRFVPYSKELLVALILAFSLPGSYSIPLFGKFEGHREYVSTTISLSTLVTLLVFVGLTVYINL
ncbi:MAG: AEC family transporter [Anaerolineaceae bacterium]|nr:AEC family transporter [Anaerolineaceae bacterium]